MLPWISATAASVDRPSPTDTSSSGVACRAGAGWRRPAAPRARRRRGAARGQPHHGRRRRAGTAARVASAAAQKYSAKLRSAAVAMVSATSASGQHRVGRDQRARVGTRTLRQQRVAEQRGAGDARGPAQRPQREAQRGQQAVAARPAAAAPGRSQHRRHRQQVAQQPCAGQRQGRAREPARARCRRSASAITWIRQTANTSRAEAPRQRSVAMVRARASSQARTPLATPMPPTSSEVSPTRVRNRLVWSMNRVTPGAASRGSRMRQPGVGKRGAQVVGQRRHRGRRRQASAAARNAPWSRATIRPVCRQRGGEISTRGPSMAGVATRSGSRQRAARRGTWQCPAAPCRPDAGPADPARPDRPAGRNARRVGAKRRRPPAAAGRQRRGADQRPGGVDRLQLDQLPLARGRDQHRAHLHHVGDRRAPRAQPVAQRVGQGLRAGVDLQIAAQQRAAVGGQAGVDGRAQGADRGDHRHAQRQASSTMLRPRTPPRSSRRARRSARPGRSGDEGSQGSALNRQRALPPGPQQRRAFAIHRLEWSTEAAPAVGANGPIPTYGRRPLQVKGSRVRPGEVRGRAPWSGPGAKPLALPSITPTAARAHAGTGTATATRPSARCTRGRSAPRGGVVGDQQQRGAVRARAARTAGPSPSRRWRGRGCRSARRPAAAAAPARRRGRGRRAAARRRRAGRAGGSAGGPARPRAAPPRARSMASRTAGQFQRHGDVLQRGHGRDQVEGLEHDADMLRAAAAPAHPRPAR